MKLIIWLWNPWKEYEKTRHNVWFMFLDFLKEKYEFEEFKEEKKFKWEISDWNFLQEKTILLKPITFMNLSWEATIELLNFYKIDKKDIIVVSDDKDMEFWKIRFRETWSAGGHNWLKSIIKYLWEDFKRIKIWVWNDEKYDTADWVLSKFSNEELPELKNIFEKSEETLISKL
jgi:PTH1 family peptidyl-tRNA hydrolase